MPAAARGALAVIAALLIALSVPSIARADIFVNTTADTRTGCPTVCSIRAAIAAAVPGNTVIRVPAGTYTLTIGELNIPGQTSGLTIIGAGARSTIIRGDAAERVLLVQGGANTVSGVTITNGRADNPSGDDQGGGIYVQTGALTLTDSTVAGNTAARGGGVAVDGTFTGVRSTLAGNRAAIGQGPTGGGIHVQSVATLINSTVSGNEAVGTPAPDFSLGGGAYVEEGGNLDLRNTTLARNRAPSGGGLYVNVAGDAVASNTIIADSLAGGACFFDSSGQLTSRHTIADDTTCNLTGAGDKPNVDPGLGLLANNGGPTNTHLIARSSAALNAGSQCEPNDQRGVGRPQIGACDMGAVEYVDPTLRVVTRVVNDDGGNAGVGGFQARVLRNGADVPGSPQPGNAAGTLYNLTAGSFVVTSSTKELYDRSITGDCAPDGSVGLGERQNKTCVITFDDKNVVPRRFNALTRKGAIRIKPPGATRWETLGEGSQIPAGTSVDARKGQVTLYAAADKSGGIAWAYFYSGVFKLAYKGGSKPTTILKLTQKLRCTKKADKASTAKKKKKRRGKRKRRLWGNGKGRFRTKGRFSAATVLGTKWLTEDRCTSTRTKVVRGKVSVRDFARRKTVVVKRGKTYVARKKVRRR